jgi:hypothetical protein
VDGGGASVCESESERVEYRVFECDEEQGLNKNQSLVISHSLGTSSSELEFQTKTFASDLHPRNSHREFHL